MIQIKLALARAPADLYDANDQLPPAIERLYSDARAAGFLGVLIWGGEPLLHRDFDEVVRHAHDLGLVTHRVTKGFVLERKFDAVVPWLDRMCISLDHPSPLHDELPGMPPKAPTRASPPTRRARPSSPSRPVRCAA